MRAAIASLLLLALVACGSHNKAQRKAQPADVEIFWPDADLDTSTVDTAAADAAPTLDPPASTPTPESKGNAEVAP